MRNETRNTIQKELTKNAVYELMNHPTAEEIYEYVSKGYKSISKATVYRNLNILAENGEISKIEIPNAPMKYDHVLENHYHLKCNKCGKVFDSEVKYNKKFLDIFKETNDFEVENFNLIINGVCLNCKNN